MLLAVWVKTCSVYMMACRVSCVLLLCLIAVCCDARRSNFPSSKLFDNLMRNYNKHLMPRESQGSPLEVSFSISLQALHEVDLRHGTITLNLWENMNWRDFRLAWNPKDYGGIKAIRLPPKLVWLPDICLYNPAGPAVSTATGPNPQLVVLSSDGGISYIPTKLLTSMCSLGSGQHFDCELRFGSWVYNGGSINITSPGYIDVTTYKFHRDYELVAYNTTRKVSTYECCPDPYIDIRMSLGYKKRDKPLTENGE